MIDGIAMKGKRIIIPFIVQSEILEQLHNNHGGIEKNKAFGREWVYWVNMKTGNENTIKQFATCLECQQVQLQEKTIPCEVPCRSWELFGADIFN